LITHFFLQNSDFKFSEDMVTLRPIIPNGNVTLLFRRLIRRIEPLAGGMMSERDLQVHRIMGRKRNSLTVLLVALCSGCHASYSVPLEIRQSGELPALKNTFERCFSLEAGVLR
jgi:hypothetical protein